LLYERKNGKVSYCEVYTAKNSAHMLNQLLDPIVYQITFIVFVGVSGKGNVIWKTKFVVAIIFLVNASDL
jgi:hypothetical protein